VREHADKEAIRSLDSEHRLNRLKSARSHRHAPPPPAPARKPLHDRANRRADIRITDSESPASAYFAGIADEFCHAKIVVNLPPDAKTCDNVVASKAA
jgi:hypothetical protein